MYVCRCVLPWRMFPFVNTSWESCVRVLHSYSRTSLLVFLCCLLSCLPCVSCVKCFSLSFSLLCSASYAFRIVPCRVSFGASATSCPSVRVESVLPHACARVYASSPDLVVEFLLVIAYASCVSRLKLWSFGPSVL